MLRPVQAGPARGCAALRGARHDGAVAGKRRRWCPANRVAYGLIGLAQKEAWGSGVLTETWQKSEMRRTMVHVEVGGGDGVGLAVGGRDGAAPGS